ncbi:acyl-CoA dehydrogenase family protein [Bosea vaviloviae]|jgi:alkylation response protein AidB-like acyl-CoA dehydrogenase|uniref:Acyl-CoA dehydrogenase n=1 Tax=Bosea vaviloviae TaxID=1526658 RepID=A0A0N1N2E6_9HYPH|nr:acyl-CoA dehydrogenase family protein [Bosea vaviloviae]KPH83140.1 acyl-CoA dehydrogenase [Bosea vaviloviae]
MKSLAHFEQSRNWTVEESLVIEQVSRLASQIVAPNANGFDERKEFPWANFNAFREVGLNGIFIPEEYGGSPISYRCFLEIVRILSEACAATGIIFGTTAAAVKPILEFGTEEQKRRLLPRIAEGGLGALAITEPHAGSDGGNIRTKFRPDGDDIVINGGKIFITTGDVADLILLFGKWSGLEDSPKAVSAVILEKGTPGFEVVRLETKMGTHASSTAELAFTECRIPRANLVGQPGDGMKIMVSVLNKSRPSVASQALGIASAAFNDMVAYANERRQGGKRVIEHQAIAFMIADLAIELLASRNLLDHVGRLVDDGIKDISVEASMIKVKASDLAMRLTTDAVQVFGGHGYVSGHRVERLMREAKITQIWEGTNQIQRQVISRDLIAR